MTHRIDAGLLGPLIFDLNDRASCPTAPKQRQLLALLLAHASHVVTVPTMIEELWEEPPRSATTVIQTYILAIRKNVAATLEIDQETVTSEIIQTRDRGYSLSSDACHLDVHRYDRLTARAREELARGRQGAAIDCFIRAERLWRGRALIDVECGLPLSIHATRLDQVRLANIELRLEAQLRQRLYRDVIIDLTAFVLQHPFNERLHAYLMYALCLSGSRARAQEVFTRLRQAMIEELGLEPCAKVQRLHRDILRASDPHIRAVLEHDRSEYLFWHDGTSELDPEYGHPLVLPSAS